MEKLQGRINLPDQDYDITIGSGVCNSVRDIIDRLPGRPFFVVDGGIPALPCPAHSRVLRVPGGEAIKTMDFVRTLIHRLVLSGMHKTDFLVVVGGGTLLDAAGMAAGLLFRGVPMVSCPATSTAMADAVIGGKTGVNLPWGKNLVGMFKHPDLVLVDPQFLLTLGMRDLYAGLFEVLKTSLLAGGDMWYYVSEHVAALIDRDQDAWTRVITMSLNFKLNVVKADPLDQGARHVLNLGHTIGHAIEAATAFRTFRHGEAVLMGIVAAVELSYAQGLMCLDTKRTILNAIARFHLPHMKELEVDALKDSLALDKKAGTWVLLHDIGRPELVHGIQWHQVRAALVTSLEWLKHSGRTYSVRPPNAVILVINGPNLQRLGAREPKIYGHDTYSDLVTLVRRHANELGVHTIFFQSDIEGELIATINRLAGIVDGIVINPGALTHTGIGLRDALAACNRPVAEVHISKVSEREPFRQKSLIRPIAYTRIEGQGIAGYVQALDRLVQGALKSAPQP